MFIISKIQKLNNTIYYSTIFKTVKDNDIDKWTAKIEIFGKSFNEIGTAIKNIKNEDLSFIDKLKKIFSTISPFGNGNKDWIRNSLGEIVSKDNIDSYIKELDLDKANEKVTSILNHKKLVDENKKSWQDYFDTCKGGNKYIIDVIKNTDDLSKLTGKDLVAANQKARTSVIEHNKTLKEQTLSAKLSAIGMNLLSTALNVGLTFAITTAMQLIYQFVTAQKQLQKAAAETGSTFAEKAKDIDKHYITKKS